MDKDTITISKREYESLLNSKKTLESLNMAGVDNWEGYEYAQELYENLEEI